MLKRTPKNSFTKSKISAKKRNQASSQKPDVTLHATNSKKNCLGSLGTKWLRDARSHLLSIRINLC